MSAPRQFRNSAIHRPLKENRGPKNTQPAGTAARARKLRPITPAIACLLFLGLLLSLSSAEAQPVRIVSWNMEPGDTAAPAPGALNPRIAALKELAPDILILFHAPDWKGCQQIALALDPTRYSVHVCSAFPGSSELARGDHQMAILSRQKAYFSWSEGWENEAGTARGSEGFAFAAIQAGSQRIGVFVVSPNPADQWGSASVEARQWSRTVGAFRKWVTNRLEAVVVAYRAENGASLLEPGLSRPFAKNLALPTGPANTFSATMPTDADALPVFLLGKSPVLCELDVKPGQPMQARALRIEPALITHPLSRLMVCYVMPWSGPLLAVFGLVAFLWAVWRLRRRARRIAAPRAVKLLDRGGSALFADTVVVAPWSATATSTDNGSTAERLPVPPVVSLESDAATRTQSQSLTALPPGFAREPLPESVKAGVIANLSQWLKRAFIRRVLGDRELLLEGQEQALSKAAAMDERLARIEAQIQQQTRVYEEQILELTRELETARQENRALILERIDQVKGEMEAARARINRDLP